MRIVHYLPGLPPVRSGGMMKYALDLATAEKNMGNEVILLIPGKITKSHKLRIRSTKWNGFCVYQMQNALLITEGRNVENIADLYRKVEEEPILQFLNEARPDVIHLHTLMGLPKEVLLIAERLQIRTIYTTHDFYGICPKFTLQTNAGSECGDCKQCDSCLGTIVSNRSLKRKHTDFYRRLKENKFVHWLEYSKTALRWKLWIRSIKSKSADGEKTEIDMAAMPTNNDRAEQYQILMDYYKEMFTKITGFHFNSEQTRSVFESHLGKLSGEVIWISDSNIRDQRKKRTFGKTLQIGYLANKQLYKGYHLLQSALKRLYEEGNTDFVCHIYMNEEKMGIPYMISHEPYTERQMDEVFEQMDVLVLPSTWRETFGLVVLEAISYGIPVIISDMVGAKELFERNHKACRLIASKEDELYTCLKNIYEDRSILEEMNQVICESDFPLCYEKHVEDMLDLYQKE